MNATTAEPELLAFELSPRESVRVFERAIRARAMITLEPRSPTEGWPLVGQIETTSAESVCILLDDDAVIVPHSLASMNCDAVVVLELERFLFSTNIMAVIDADVPARIEIARPGALHVMQRRRFWRSAIRGSTAVELSGQRETEDWQISGALLNVGFDGIACKMAAHDANCTSVGDTARVCFSLEQSAGPFGFDGVIRSKHPAGSEGFTIIGLQFSGVSRRDGERQRLACALGYDSSGKERNGDHGWHPQHQA